MRRWAGRRGRCELGEWAGKDKAARMIIRRLADGKWAM